ncbi:TetR/AcrR family transcriptional regulator [bacterium]|nr:TetR/AcrR family transcriptional regulator [bacterium]
MNEQGTKEKILKTAALLFGKYGKNGVSTTAIAQAAKVNKALIFYYYGSKDELYRAVFKNLISSFIDTIHSTMASSEPGLPALESFIRIHSSLISENQYILRLLIRELMVPVGDKPSPLLIEAAEIFKTVRNDLANALSSAKNSRQIRSVDSFQTIISILSLDIFFFIGKPIALMIYPQIDEQEFVKKRVEHIIDLIMNGLKIDQE